MGETYSSRIKNPHRYFLIYCYIELKMRKTTPTSSSKMIPLHIKISEEMHHLLTTVAEQHGFPRIQGLIRLYIRQGLDAENVRYQLKNDIRFIEKLKRQGVSEEIINQALATHDEEMKNT